MLGRLSGLFAHRGQDQKPVRSTMVFKSIEVAEEALLQPHKRLS